MANVTGTLQDDLRELIELADEFDEEFEVAFTETPDLESITELEANYIGHLSTTIIDIARYYRHSLKQGMAIDRVENTSILNQGEHFYTLIRKLSNDELVGSSHWTKLVKLVEKIRNKARYIVQVHGGYERKETFNQERQLRSPVINIVSTVLNECNK